MQPLYGYLSDRLRSRMFTVPGPAAAGLFIFEPGIGGTLHSPAGNGGARGRRHCLFPPTGGGQRGRRIQRHRGRAMVVFVCSGPLGPAAGPIFFSALTGGGTLAHLHWGMGCLSDETKNAG